MSLDQHAATRFYKQKLLDGKVKNKIKIKTNIIKINFIQELTRNSVAL